MNHYIKCICKWMNGQNGKKNCLILYNTNKNEKIEKAALLLGVV